MVSGGLAGAATTTGCGTKDKLYTQLRFMKRHTTGPCTFATRCMAFSYNCAFSSSAVGHCRTAVVPDVDILGRSSKALVTVYRLPPPVNDVVRPVDAAGVVAACLKSVLFWDNMGGMVPNSSVVGLTGVDAGAVLKAFGVSLGGGL